MESPNTNPSLTKIESHYIPFNKEKEQETSKLRHSSLPYVDSTKPNSEYISTKIIDSTSLNSSENMDKIINLVASSIKEIIEINSRFCSVNQSKSTQEASLFYSKRVPNITIEAYLQRIVKYTKIEASTLILSSIYVDRFCEKYEYFLSPHTVYRLILVSILVAIKFNEDIFYENSFYAKVGGIDLLEINSLEQYLLESLDYKLYLQSEIYYNYQNFILEDITVNKDLDSSFDSL